MASQIRRALPAGVSFFRGQPSDDRQRESRRLLKKTRLKSASKGLKAEQAKYRRLSATFLARPENKWCVCCDLRREAGEDILRNQATEVHHHRGRIGKLLCWLPGFRAFCFFCRTWPHDHPALARKLNLLAPPSLWNIYPGEY